MEEKDAVGGLTKIYLIILIVFALSLTLSPAQSLQAINDAAKGPVDIAVGPRVFLPDQAKLTFQAAWKEFREAHTYNIDGEFEIGGSCDDNQDTLDTFYIHLSKHRLTKTIHFMQRCSLCSGSGKIQTAPDGIVGNNNCPNCRGSGREEAANTYTFYVLPINVPAKPETPRQKQEKALRASVAKELADLESLHSSGDIAASLRLGKIYAEGYHFIPKDSPKSEPYFLKAMSLGSEAGLEGYLRARESAFKGNPNEALLIYAMRLAKPSASTTTPPVHLSYTEHLVAQAIAERTLTLLRKARLVADDLKLAKLRDIARSPNGAEPLSNHRTPQANPFIQEFLSNAQPPRIAGSTFRKLRLAALAKGNGAFGMLADFIQNGEGPSTLRNAQAAHIYYKLEFLTSGDPYALECARHIEGNVDPRTTEFFLTEYRRLLAEASVTENTLAAADEIHPLVSIAK